MKKNNSFLKIVNLDSVDSTNNYAFHLAENKCREITVIRANSQTKGKGRMQRSWDSSSGGGIYASFVLRPNNRLEEIALLPLLFSLGAAQVLADFLDIKIEWPNDVVYKNKKIAGVLVEARGTNEKTDFAVAGIGININAKKGEIPDRGTSLHIETGKMFDTNRLFQRLIKVIIPIYTKFKSGSINELLDSVFYFCEKKERLKIAEQCPLMKDQLMSNIENSPGGNKIKELINLI